MTQLGQFGELHFLLEILVFNFFCSLFQIGGESENLWSMDDSMVIKKSSCSFFFGSLLRIG